jgi:hypothetical protein
MIPSVQVRQGKLSRSPVWEAMGLQWRLRPILAGSRSRFRK